MKYLPLVWAAVLRKPMRACMTLLAVTVAFTVFGLMIGLSTAIDGSSSVLVPTASFPARASAMRMACPSQWGTASPASPV
jgi:hypothetical protein